MAANFNTSNATTNVQAGNFKKADSFINLYAEDASGKSHKVGFLALYKDNALHQAMIEHIEANPEAGVYDVLSSFQADYRSAVPTVSNAKFSFKKAA